MVGVIEQLLDLIPSRLKIYFVDMNEAAKKNQLPQFQAGYSAVQEAQ